MILLPSARAATYVVDLSSADSFNANASSGIWNTVSGRIEAPPSAEDSPSAGTYAPGRELDFGDGSDGAFSDGPAQTGISVSGSTIYIDTDVKSEFHFTSFTLSAGRTIQVSGSVPLRIRVLGSTRIDGAIESFGVNGEDAAAAGPEQGGAAGDGAAAGSPGGVGGTPWNNNDAGTGQPYSGTPNGGGRGSEIYIAGSASQQGGGGGCSGTGSADDATSGANAANAGSCATGYLTRAEAFESSFSGGAGGGGGGALDDFGASAMYSGGGGGGGGGAIQIVSLDSISLSGSVDVAGGNGGAYNEGAGGNCGGGGGGGSGGSIWLQTASSVTGAGTLHVEGGLGGTSTVCPGAYNGGNGSRGIVRIDTPSGTATTSPAGVADVFSVAVAPAQNYQIVSKALDFSHGYYEFGVPVVSTGCGSQGTLAVTYQGSLDGSQFSNTVTGSELHKLSDYPYLRFIASISTTGTAPPCLTGLSIPYELREISEIRLNGGLFCGNLNFTRRDEGADQSRSSSPFSFLGDLFILGLASLAAIRHRIHFRKPC